MARVLFCIQLIVALVVLPLWPGLDPRYSVFGLGLLGLLVLGTLGTVVAVFGVRTAVRALADAGAVGPLGPRAGSSVDVWRLAARTFPISGILGGLVTVIGALTTLDAARPLPVQAVTLVFFALVWGLLGLLIGRILERVVIGLTRLPRTGAASLVPSIAGRFGLTARESEAAGAILDGLTYRDAGTKLGIAPTTVKSHVLRVYEKTGAGNKIELLRMVEAEALRIHQTEDGALGGPVRD